MILANMFENKKRALILFAVGTIIVASLLVTALLFKKNVLRNNVSDKQQEANINKEIVDVFDNGISGSDSSDYNPQKIINEVENLMSTGKNLSLGNRAFAKVILSELYRSSDYGKSVELLKEVISSDKYPAYYRALAIQGITDNYYFITSDSYYENNFFVGDYLGKFIENGNIPLAFMRLNEFSDQLFPTAIANYRVALYLSERIASDSELNQKKSDFEAAGKRIEKGDQLMKSEISGQNGPALPYYMAAGDYMVKAQALENLLFNYPDNKNITAENVIEQYKESIRISEIQPVNFYAITASFYSRFYYASFLSEIDSEKNSGTIIDELEPIINNAANNKEFIVSYPIYRMLREQRVNQESQEGQAIDRLSKVDPDFKKLVEGL